MVFKLLLLQPNMMLRSLKATLGINPGLIGEKKLWEIIKNAPQNENIKITQRGVWVGNTFHESLAHILKFVSKNGIVTNKNKLNSYIDLRNLVKGDNPDLDKTYFRAMALYFFTTYGSVIVNALIVLKITQFIDLDSFVRAAFTAAWLIPNLYFLVQLYIYHISRLESIKLAHTFKEAEPEEVEMFNNKTELPKVISVIPSYLEDSKLIRNSLYSHCLQKYANKKIVLLLGNDYYTDNVSVLQNTQENITVVEDIRKEFNANYDKINKKTTEIRNRPNKGANAMPVFKEIADIYLFVVEWFDEKKNTIISDSDFPTRDFLIEHTFEKQRQYYLDKANYCLNLINKNNLPGNNDENERLINVFIRECESVFKMELIVFQRYKYINAEHERTKAGNLTAYISLLDKEWKEVCTEDGKFEIQIEGVNKQQPDYLAIFDSDTIVKPDYLIRKVIYMDNPANSKTGLIQSPYHVPTPEPTSPASASGVHSHWFLPISIGLSSYKSAFWLGFNGVFRYEAVKKINGSFIADTLIEDLENSLKILKNGYAIVTSPEYQCQTFSPPDMRGVHVQRERWASGGFRIGLNYLKDTFKGKYHQSGSWAMVLRLNYILGLNLLPLVITMTLILELPYYNNFYLLEVIPFFFYLITYTACLKTTSYKIKHYLDGLSISLFMNFHYLRGTWTSLKVLFKKETAQIFKATPRTRNKIRISLGQLEFFGLIILAAFMIMRINNNINGGHYYDIFPYYQLLCILYGIPRFIGGKAFLVNIKEIIKPRN